MRFLLPFGLPRRLSLAAGTGADVGAEATGSARTAPGFFNACFCPATSIGVTVMPAALASGKWLIVSASSVFCMPGYAASDSANDARFRSQCFRHDRFPL